MQTIYTVNSSPFTTLTKTESFQGYSDSCCKLCQKAFWLWPSEENIVYRAALKSLASDCMLKPKGKSIKCRSVEFPTTLLHGMDFR